MAIQFFCVACRQPIEVDDNMANQAVTCPYCRAPQGRNTLSWASLGCVVASFAIIAILTGVGISIARGIDPNTPPQEIGKKINEELQKRPGVQVMSIVGTCVLPVVGVICACAALFRRTPPRWPAIVSLVLCGGLAILACLGLVVGLAGAGKPGG
jgi:hypothetical protein